MSQFYQGVTAGSLPPSVPTSFDARNQGVSAGISVPVANIEIFNSTNDALTLSVSGNQINFTVNPTVITGTVTTVGAVTGNVITIALGSTPGTYTFDCKIAGFDSSTPSGAGYTIVGAVRTTGVAATLLAGQAVDSFEEAATAACTGTLTVSGNNAIFQVLGAAGVTIDWKASVQYIFVE